jgi:NAD-dependent SIR2 family protein deacetylase
MKRPASALLSPKAEPEAADPVAAKPKAARPKAAKPKAAKPKAAKPKAAKPNAAAPALAAPHAAGASAAAPASAARDAASVSEAAFASPPVLDVEGVHAALRGARYVVVLCGAGISVGSGVPDFRSRDGIYALAQSMRLGLPQPECLFDLEFFRDDPEPFFRFAKVLYGEGRAEGPYVPSAAHYFLRLLAASGRLGRVYTQNIDGLEAAACVPGAKLVQCHGSLRKARCLNCGAAADAGDADGAFRLAVRQGVPARCARADRGGQNCGGVLKPAVTFFGEPIAGAVAQRLRADVAKCDLLLVMGSSLQVAPMSSLPDWIAQHVPCVLLNKETVKPRGADSRRFDVELLGDAGLICRDLARSIAAGGAGRKPSSKLLGALSDFEAHAGGAPPALVWEQLASGRFQAATINQ